MEFLPYAQIRRTLGEQGIVEQIEDQRLRLVIRDPVEKWASKTARVVFGSADSRNGARRIPMAPGRTGEIAERLLQKAHVDDFVIIPAGRWRPILDIIAFDLASNEVWLEVDADASLHQNTREPLGLLARQRAVLREILESLHTRDAGDECDLEIAALGSPFVLEASPRGTLTLQCPEAIADTLVNAITGE